MEGHWVVVTSSHRDVWFGFSPAPLDMIAQKFGVLENCRHVRHWKPRNEAKGLGALAVEGPGEGSQIGPAVGLALVTDVVSIWFVEPKALPVWDASIW